MSPLLESCLKPEAGLGLRLLLLRGVGRVWIHFARNLVLRLRRLGGIKVCIGGAAIKRNDSASQKEETQVFHGEINNKDVKRLQALQS
jgi:hypothetical protein